MWFDEVKIKHRPADSPGMEPVPEPPGGMTSNALADKFRR